MNRYKSLESMDFEELNSLTLKTMANNKINWNIQSTKIKLEELMLLLMNFSQSALCLQKTFLKENEEINIKIYTSHNYKIDQTD